MLLTRLGTRAARHWRRTLLVAIVVVAGIGTLGSSLGAGFVDDYRTPGVDSTKAQDLLEQRFPQSPAVTPSSCSPATARRSPAPV